MPNTHTTLTGLFSDIADAVRAKTGGSAAITADSFPEAIGNIALCGSSLKIDESPFVSAGVAELTLRSALDGSSATLDWPEPDCLPQNIAEGKTVLGVEGEAKNYTAQSGEYTVGAADVSTYINIQGVIYPQVLSLSISASVAKEIAAQKNKNVISSVRCYSGGASSELATLSYYDPQGVQHTGTVPVSFSSTRARIYLIAGGTVYADAVFSANTEYQWNAILWG